MRHKFLIISIIIITIVILVCLYNCAAVLTSRNAFIQNKQTINLVSNSASLNLDLRKDSYLLKVNYIFKKGQEKTIYFNGVKLVPSLITRGSQEKNYVILPKRLVKDGQNLLSVNFLKTYPSNLVVKIQNYYFKLYDSVYVLSSDYANLSQKNRGYSFGQYKIAITRTLFWYLIFFFSFLFASLHLPKN